MNEREMEEHRLTNIEAAAALGLLWWLEEQI